MFHQLRGFLSKRTTPRVFSEMVLHHKNPSPNNTINIFLGILIKIYKIALESHPILKGVQRMDCPTDLFLCSCGFCITHWTKLHKSIYHVFCNVVIILTSKIVSRCDFLMCSFTMAGINCIKNFFRTTYNLAVNRLVIIDLHPLRW